jgi:hypothetical protein
LSEKLVVVDLQEELIPVVVGILPSGVELRVHHGRLFYNRNLSHLFDIKLAVPATRTLPSILSLEELFSSVAVMPLGLQHHIRFFISLFRSTCSHSL